MTNGEQELAGLRQAFAAESHLAPSPEVCPAPEALWEAVRGTLPPAAVREVVQHTAACPACAEDWRLARTLQEQEAAAAAPALVKAPLVFRRVRSWGLAAAAVLALAVVGVQWFRQPSTPVYREGGRTTIQSQLAEGKALPRDHFVLRWTAPVPAGATYGVEVSTEDLQAVASAEGLRSTQYQVPPDALKDLPSGSRLLWKVDADLPAGGRVSSRTFVTAVQ